MNRPTTLALVLIAGLALALPDRAAAQYEDIPEAVSSEIVIKTESNFSLDVLLARLWDVMGEENVEVFRAQDEIDVYTIRFLTEPTSEQAVDLRAILDGSVDDGTINWAEPNIFLDSVGGQTDSLWVSGLGIDREGYEDQFAKDLLDLQFAHQVSTGHGVLVGVVDTGIDPDHEVMRNRVAATGTSLLSSYATPYDDPSSNPAAVNALWGHGTFIAGLVALVAPDATFLPIRVLDSEGLGTTETAAAGIVAAVNGGCQVITLAFGTSLQSQAMNSAIQYATQSGVIVIAAAGNLGELGCFYPASNAATIAVAASDHLDQFDPVSNWCESLDVCAPGSMLLVGNAPDPAASIIGPVPGSLDTSDYKAGRGTSFAVGFTAGIAALVRAQHPDWPGKGVEPQQIPGLIEARLEDAVSTTEVTLPGRAGTRPRVTAKGAVVLGPKAPTPGDINVDGCVDAADLGLLLAAWQQPLDATTLNLVDLDGSAEVGPADLGLLLSLWSNDCP